MNEQLITRGKLLKKTFGAHCAGRPDNQAAAREHRSYSSDAPFESMAAVVRNAIRAKTDPGRRPPWAYPTPLEKWITLQA